ncbi:MAG TPA: hypothetical protein O0X21_02455 [Methanocorpusculum sp.]|jgi:hypothetical protein|nr:hypothetical protein [Methanocorpusculum sp.]HJJ68925.1 hypothetical protein [Methanocorpusculum sp.]HJJ70723.1 hypothetical protein [Methanocorpusculum sp.]HJJ80946.1 hypothetical protein [Methanocorpusculum sp.]
MAENRTVTVSITINLGNYENLRLEVSDKAETKEEADALRYFLADVLDGYGNNNATAKAAIDKYKERILADAGKEAETEVFSFEETPMPFFPADETEYSNTAPEPVMPEFEFEPEVAEEPVQPVPQTTDAEFTCSKCGAPVTKLQRDVSMLFNHKILCKDCMK